jgi:hypothetical protein
VIRSFENSAHVRSQCLAQVQPRWKTVLKDNPASAGNRVFYGVRDGVLMQVVVSPDRRIVTAYSVNRATVRVPGGPPVATMVNIVNAGPVMDLSTR